MLIVSGIQSEGKRRHELLLDRDGTLLICLKWALLRAFLERQIRRGGLKGARRATSDSSSLELQLTTIHPSGEL